MITLIHGDNIAESRKYLQSIKEKSNPIILSPSEINLTDLSQVFEGSSLFFEQKSLVIEDYLSKVKKSKEKDAILSYINTQGQEHDITFWDAKTLTKTQFVGIKNPTERQFKLPQTLFLFLDNVKPHNTAQLIKLFQDTLTVTEPELLFFMIIRHFRLMIASLSNSKIDELKRSGDWQLTKYKKQAQLFGEQQLKRHYAQLFVIEKKQKTGTLYTDLTATIDFFLLSL